MSKLKPYDNYQSVIYDYVSQLPEGWKLLPNIAIFQERKEKNSVDMESLSISAIKGIVKASDYEERKDRTSEDTSEYLIVYQDDIAYNTMLMWAGAVGRSDFNGIVSPAYTVLKSKYANTINTKYYHYMFRTMFYKNYVKRFSYGIVDSRLRLYYTYFKRMYSVVPPLEIQNAIVEYLDRKTKQIQEFISKKERLIELLEEEKNYIINTTVTKGISKSETYYDSKFEWIGLIPSHWKIKRLRFLGSCQNGISASGEKFGKGLPFVSYSCVYKNFSLPIEVEDLVESTGSERVAYSVKEGDVFFTRTSETIEEIGFASTCLSTIENAVFAGFLIRFRPKKDLLYPKYSKYYFRSTIHRAYFVKEVDLVTRVSLGQDLLKSLPVLLPPFDEQIEIADFIEQEMDKRELLISKAKIEIEKAKEYQESLITQIVTGQLRVPEQKAESTKANWEFKEAVLIAFLTKKCATTEYPLGRKRYTKFSYLFHRYTDNKIEKYRNKAAGPYNPETKYKGPEKIAKQNKYIQESKEGKFNGFVPDENIEKALDYFCKYWTEDDVAWFDKNKFLSNDKLELIATVDKAILDLQKQAKGISFENVKKYIQESEEWKAKLKREIFSDDNIRQTIKDLDTFFS